MTPLRPSSPAHTDTHTLTHFSHQPTNPIPPRTSRPPLHRLGADSFTKTRNAESSVRIVWRVLDFAGALVIRDDNQDILSIAEIARAQIWRGRAHQELGVIFWAHSDFFKAIEHYKCAAHLYQAANDTRTYRR